MDQLDIDQVLQAYQGLSRDSLEHINLNRVEISLLHVAIYVSVQHLSHDQKVPSEHKAVIDLDETIGIGFRVRDLIEDLGFKEGIFCLTIALLADFNGHGSPILHHVAAPENLTKSTRAHHLVDKVSVPQLRGLNWQVRSIGSAVVFVPVDSHTTNRVDSLCVQDLRFLKRCELIRELSLSLLWSHSVL